MDLSCLNSSGPCRPSAQELVEGHSPTISFDEQWLAYTQATWGCGNLDLQCEAVFISPIQGDAPAINIAASLQSTLAMNDWPMWGCYYQYSHPQWSPRELTLTFSCGFDVYAYDLAAATLTNLTCIVTRFHTEHNFPEWWPRDFHPGWSPTGDRILFLSDRDEDLGQSGSDFISNAIFAMNPDGTDAIRITQQSDQMIVNYTWIFRPKSEP